jgi:hypothetical protein
MADSTPEQVLRDACKGAFTTLAYPQTGPSVRNIHVVIASTQNDVDKRIASEKAAALKRGDTLVHSDGTHEWIATYADHVETDDNAYEYVWNADGERVRCSRYRVTNLDGERTQTFLRHCWRKFENV